MEAETAVHAVEDAIEHGEAALEAGVEHGAAAFDPATSILGHVLDHPTIEVPFTSIEIPLPQITLPAFELFGYQIPAIDLSITRHIVMMWVVGALLTILFVSAARKSKEPVPHGLRNALEPLILFIRDDIARRAIPHGADRFVPYLLTTFFFILFCNLLGLIPGMSTATGNVSVTAGLALFAFFMIQGSGIREYGLFRHLRNQMPNVPVLLYPLFIVIELLSNLIRPFVLCIRLFANMMGGHVVILAFISLIFILGIYVAPVAVFFALFVHFLELLVAFLQAYIFTMLTAQFISMSVHPSH